MVDSKELQAKGKQEVTGAAEQTRPGFVFTPDVDISETNQEITLLADIPGVKVENLTIDLRDNTLTLIGDAERAVNEEKTVLAEYETGRYYRQFTLPELVDQSKIDAKLTDGVLRLRLPKIEKAAPKRIQIKVG